MKIKAGVYGASGYTGIELARLLIPHPFVEFTAVHTRSYAGTPYEEVFGSLKTCTNLICEDGTIEDFAGRCDVLFLALPHGIASHTVTEELSERCLFIDLGADFRLKKREVYEEWYGVEHGNPSLLPQAVYGLCELFRDRIAEAKLISNPGCYTTASITALAPLFAEDMVEPNSAIIDAKSGVTGAGRGVKLPLHFSETNESVKAYKVAAHRHAPEIEQALSTFSGNEVAVRFTPHLIPMNRGILATCYARPKRNIDTGELFELYRSYYGDEPFIRLLDPGEYPETRWVRGSNFLDIGLHYDERTETVVVMSALDNLVKGAAGQAVQNMNIRFGIDETEGLLQLPLFP
jgi:N-acetyl-gamma-glutamyl-phosphate reductase